MASTNRATIAFLGVLVSQTAWGQTCPDPADYSLSTMPDILARSLAFDCVGGNNQCEDNLVVYPYDDDAIQGTMVWLTGTNAKPNVYEHMLNIAGFAGYKVLAVSWENSSTTYSHCDEVVAGNNLLGGDCTDSFDCAAAVRDELNTGFDNPATSFEATRLNGLEHRIAMALQTEHALEPTYGWDAFCEPDPDIGTRIFWEDLVVGGHSVGGNHSQYISYTKDTLGAVIIEGGYDFCGVEEYPSVAQIYDGTIAYNMTGAPADYYSGTDASSARRVAMMHQTDVYPSANWPTLPPSFLSIFGTSTPSIFDVDLAGTYAGQQIIATDQTPACSSLFPYHGSMATDDCLPTSFSGATDASNPTTTTSTSSLYLFDSYLGAMCSQF